MKIRTTCPQKGNKYYNNRRHGGLSDAINGEPMIAGLTVLQNCVGFANSRFNEIINDPELSGIVLSFKYQLVCNAEDFIESARAQGLSISRTPIEGGIMVWQKGRAGYGGDGAGHVAVVEEVYTDGSILTSESGYNAWTFKTVRRSNTDGRWGQNSAYKFRGCIVNPGVPDPKVVPVPPLVVDGIGGESTVMASQHFFGTIEDGVVSGQVKSLMSQYCPSLIAVQFNLTRSTFVEKLQAWLGVKVDGVIGKGTVTAWQQKLMAFGYEIGAYGADGIFGADSMRAWQRFLNDHQDKHPDPEPTPTPPKDYTNIIDVSEFQSSIDWNKVKTDGYVGAIIRCAGRGGEKGNIYYDTKFFDHIRGAHSVGIKVGVYFLTQAINDEEGREEARITLDLVSQAGIALDYPIGIDSENVTWKNEDGSTGHGRANSNKLSAAKRTEAVGAFCDEIQKNGFKAMIYASTSWLNNQLDMSRLLYYVWVAQWSSVCEYKGAYIIWQYGKGSVSGIKGEVDLNKCYYNGGDPTPAPEPSPDPVPKKHIEEDGIAGKATIERAQTVFGTLVDGIVSGQRKNLIQKYCPALRAVAYNKVKSTLVQAIQRWAGVKDDGIWGKDTSIAVQHKLQSEGYDIGSWGADGIFSTASMKAFQKWLNEHDSPTPKPEPTPGHYDGELPTMKLIKSTDEVVADAQTFGRWITGDNRFGYGRDGGAKYKGTTAYKITHSGGCHFCGTNASKISRAKKAGLKNPEEWEFTYVCNTFVHACYAHAGVQAMLKASNHAWWIPEYQKSKDWKEIKKPSKLSDLKPGDVLAWDSHFCMYLGGGKGAEATSGTGGGNPASSKKAWADSIRICDFSKKFKQATHIFRYIGTVNSSTPIRYGEVSRRVMLMQKFLNWRGNYGLAEDGIFGDGTRDALKDFQGKNGLVPDGIAGVDTLAKMAEIAR